MIEKPIPNWPGYFVSDQGTIRGPRGPMRGRLAGPDRRQYIQVRLYNEGEWKDFYLHVLVCMLFNGPPFENAKCLHKDDDAFNNIPDNLYWGTYSDNINDMKRHKIRIGPNWWSNEEIAEMKRLYYEDGVTQTEIGRRFRCTTVSRIVRGEAFKY